MSAGLSDRQIELLAEAFEAGMSRRMAAKHAGICIRTAMKWREYYIFGEGTSPEKCGCGRPIKHMGFCQFRRAQRAR